MPSRPTTEPAWLTEYFSDERIARALQNWAGDEGVATGDIRRRVSETLASAGYCQQKAPNVEALLAVITVLRRVHAAPVRRREP